jgi:hypothetical protein
VCAAACSCSDDCRLQYASGSTQGFGNEITAASTQCRTAIAGSCEMGDLDIEACNAVADEAACVTAGSNIALEVSQACFGN